MGRFIECKNLCHTFIGPEGNEIKALDNINLQIDKGEFVAIIGTNGSGKSTLAKHLNALMLPTSGQCLINGLDTADPANTWDIRRQVGMVFQNPDNQIVAAVVEEDVAFGPENLGIDPEEIAERVEAALAAVNMLPFRHHGPHRLSGGQKQRIAIAGALAMLPDCLVLDEPTAMLDPQGRQEVLATVVRLNRERRMTIVYITHFMEEAVVADRVVVMQAGKIIMSGTPTEIFSMVAELKAIGLEVPVAAEISARLRQQCIQLPPAIITDDKLVEALCRSS